MAYHFLKVILLTSSIRTQLSGEPHDVINDLLPLLCSLAPTKENKLFKFIPWKLGKWKASVFLKKKQTKETGPEKIFLANSGSDSFFFFLFSVFFQFYDHFSPFLLKHLKESIFLDIFGGLRARPLSPPALKKAICKRLVDCSQKEGSIKHSTSIQFHRTFLGGREHTCEKRVLWRGWLFWQKKLPENLA